MIQPDLNTTMFTPVLSGIKKPAVAGRGETWWITQTWIMAHTNNLTKAFTVLLCVVYTQGDRKSYEKDEWREHEREVKTLPASTPPHICPIAARSGRDFIFWKVALNCWVVFDKCFYWPSYLNNKTGCHHLLKKPKSGLIWALSDLPHLDVSPQSQITTCCTIFFRGTVSFDVHLGGAEMITRRRCSA